MCFTFDLVFWNCHNLSKVQLDIFKYIQDYYKSEISAGQVLLAIGAIMIGLAYLVSYTVDGMLGYGIIFGLLPLAVFQLLAGLVIIVKKTVRQNKLSRQQTANKELDLDAECKEMGVVFKRFTYTRYIQEAICFMSFVTIFLGLAHIVSVLILGMSMGVLLQSAIMIAFDLFAQRRAEEYLRRLKRENEKLI